MKKFTHSAMFLAVNALLIASHAHAISPQVYLQDELYEHQNIYGVGVMLPFGGTQATPFVDLRYHADNHSQRAASLGLGYRLMNKSQHQLGINAYIDQLHSSHDQKFRQASLGLEWAYQGYQANANIYAPLGTDDKTINTQHTATLQNHTLGITTMSQSEKLGNAFDVEFGKAFTLNPNSTVTTFAQGYWQQGQDDDNHGIRLKADWQFRPTSWGNTNLTLGSFVGYDKQDDFNVGLKLGIHFGNRQNNPMTSPVRRALLPVADTYYNSSFEAANGYNNNVYEINQTLSTTELNNTLTNAGANAVILMSKSQTVDSSLSLQDSQKLYGAGSMINLSTPSGNTATYTVAGDTPTVIHNSNSTSDTLLLGSNTNVENIALAGGKSAISTINSTSQNIHINNVDISNTAGHGIELDGVDGITITNSKVHDLMICENNTSCEFSVYNPNVVPNSAFSAIGSNNIQIDNMDIKNVTYGVFIASQMDSTGDDYETVSDNISLKNINLTNTRREGLLLVGVDNATIDNYNINNQERIDNDSNDMDLVVIQASQNVAMSNMNLVGGINGLMFVNSSNLPEPTQNNITAKNITITNPSRSGIFINPYNGIDFDNVTINQPNDSGIFMYGSAWMGAVQNVNFNNVTINNAKTSTLTLWGELQNINGDITSTNETKRCSSNAWMAPTITQNNGESFSVNGETVSKDQCL